MSTHLSFQGLGRQSAAAVGSSLQKLPDFGTPKYKALPPELKAAIARADQFNGVNDHEFNKALDEINGHHYHSQFYALDR